MIDGNLMQEILSGLAGYSTTEREEAADLVTDVVKSFSPEQANEVARALVRVAMAEDDEDCRDSELNALDELTVWQPVDRDILPRVFQLDPATLGVSEREYLANLRDYYEESQP